MKKFNIVEWQKKHLLNESRLNEVDSETIVKYTDDNGKDHEIKYDSAMKYDDKHPAKVAALSMSDDDSDKEAGQEKEPTGKLSGTDFERGSDRDDVRSPEVKQQDLNLKKYLDTIPDQVRKAEKDIEDDYIDPETGDFRMANPDFGAYHEDFVENVTWLANYSQHTNSEGLRGNIELKYHVPELSIYLDRLDFDNIPSSEKEDTVGRTKKNSYFRYRTYS